MTLPEGWYDGIATANHAYYAKIGEPSRRYLTV